MRFHWVKNQLGQIRFRWVVRILCGGGLLCLFAFLTWRASPWLRTIEWMPRWLAGWADRHGDLRNLPAFAGLCLGLMACLGRTWGMVLAMIAAVGLEWRQRWIPSRGFSWTDIWISCAGVAAAWLVTSLWVWWRRAAVRRAS